MYNETGSLSFVACQISTALASYTAHLSLEIGRFDPEQLLDLCKELLGAPAPNGDLFSRLHNGEERELGFDDCRQLLGKTNGAKQHVPKVSCVDRQDVREARRVEGPAMLFGHSGTKASALTVMCTPRIFPT
jgi:hypothetical protein